MKSPPRTVENLLPIPSGGTGNSTTVSGLEHEDDDVSDHTEDADEDATSSSGISSSPSPSSDEGSVGAHENADEVESTADMPDTVSESESHSSVKGTPPPPPDSKQASDLRQRLAAFIPQLAKANADLEDDDNDNSSKGASARRIDDVPDDEDHYIEMNLGLGVLSEKAPGDDDIRLSEPSSGSEDGDGGEDEDDRGSAADDNDDSTEQHDVLARLMGEKRSSHSKKRKIEEVE